MENQSPTTIPQANSPIGDSIIKAVDSPKTTSLTVKQRKWIDKYIELGNATEAAMQVYDCKDRDSARAIGAENLSKLIIAELMEEKGLTDIKLINKLNEGLDATRVISAVKGTSANGGTTDFIDVPDFMSRHKYLETAFKLKKRLENKDNGQTLVDAKVIIFNINGNNKPNGSISSPIETIESIRDAV
jgi:hypothetical protein